MRVLRCLGWALCVMHSTVPAFWLAVHPFADYWRTRRRSPFRVLLPVWLGMWIAVGALTWPWRHLFLYRSAWTWIPGGLLLATGLVIYSQALRGFSGTYLSGRAELEAPHTKPLVTSGIRARTRHPIYLGHFCEMLGWTIGTGMLVLYAMTAFAAITGAFMLRLEDAELERRFGDEYRLYKQRVPAFLPKM